MNRFTVAWGLAALCVALVVAEWLIERRRGK